ncbi:MAG: SPOR domain-containing protein [Gemmatimonadota bacterium]
MTYCRPGVARFLALLALVALSVAMPAAPLRAQDADSTVTRVQRLVNAGDRAGAHRLADSLLALSADGTSPHAEALFARAFASSSAVEAERDYLRVSVEYPLSPRSEDATMMVAQLKLARSDRIGARRNFERLVREHPRSPQAAKAAFWAGRLAIEDGDALHGCPSLGRARAAVAPDDVELGNQIDYYAQGCTPSALAGLSTVAESLPASPVTSPVPAPRTTPPRPAPRTPTPPPPVPVVVPEPVAPVDSAPPAPPGKEYTVQVAIFPKQRDADALAQVLTQRGFPVRVWGTAPPFRVRVGRYASPEEAEAAKSQMKAKRINGVVVEAEKP